MLNPHYLNQRLLDLGPFDPKQKGACLFQMVNPAPWNKIWRSSYLQGINLSFQEYESANDFYFVECGLAEARSIASLNEVLVRYREWSGSTQHSAKPFPVGFIRALVNIKARLIRKGLYETYRETFLEAVVVHLRYNLTVARKYSDLNAIHAIIDAYDAGLPFELGLLAPSAKAKLNRVDAIVDDSRRWLFDAMAE